MNRATVSSAPAHNPRDRLRALVQAEVARANPADTARRSLELIVESSVRAREVDGELVVSVLDDSGAPRMREEDGRQVPVTLTELVDELRHKHPTLFKAGTARPAEPVQHPVPAAPPSQPRQRDWLALASNEGASAPQAALEPDDAPELRAPSMLSASAARMSAARSGLGSALGHMRERLAARQRGKRAKSEAHAALPPVPALPPARRRWRPMAAATAALVVLAGGTALLLPRPAPEPEQASLKTPAASRTARTAEALDPATTGSVAASQAQTAANGRLTGLPEVLDTSTLRVQDRIVRLFGVEWARGGGDPDDLVKYLRGREITCEPAGGADSYRCQVEGQDLSRVVLFNGGGRATPEATPELRAAEDHARSNKMGVWKEARQPPPPPAP
ncbi:MAG TPA: hypothetical protein VGU45_02885 [Microvirga sp.]|jgi:hypothetical protein|nr:hypothetical protein [Microvirga sp.]